MSKSKLYREIAESSCRLWNRCNPNDQKTAEEFGSEADRTIRRICRLVADHKRLSRKRQRRFQRRKAKQ